MLYSLPSVLTLCCTPERVVCRLETLLFSPSTLVCIAAVSYTHLTQNGAEVKTKFSLKTPVEETDKLLALHNKRCV